MPNVVSIYSGGGGLDLIVDPDSYAENWAISNAISYETSQSDDLSWLD